MDLPARTLRLAHRGDWRHAPENSLAALLAAEAVPGCDGLEFDVRRSSDGVPVLLHDETLKRVYGRPDRVDELTVEPLEAVGIPTLADALAAIPRRAFLDVELKGEHDRTVVEVLASGGERTCATRWSRRSSGPRSNGSGASPHCGRVGSMPRRSVPR
jgi:glycerophosphoryl diester phosphodiesterase